MKRKEFEVKEHEFSEEFLKEEELKMQKYFKKDSKIIEMVNKFQHFIYTPFSTFEYQPDEINSNIDDIHRKWSRFEYG